jgi:hypothetical protein
MLDKPKVNGNLVCLMLFIGLLCWACYSTPPFYVNLVGKLDASCGEKVMFMWLPCSLTGQPLHSQLPPLPHVQMSHVVGCFLK